MAIKPRKLIGLILGAGVVGLTIYAVKKYYDEKRQNAASIGLDEAREIVAEDKANAERDHVDPTIEDVKMDARNQAFVDTNFNKDGSIDNEGVKFDSHSAAYDKVGFNGKMDYGTKNEHELSPEEMARLKEDSKDSAHWSVQAVKTDELAATLASMEEQDETEDDLIMSGPDPEELQQSKGYFEEDKELLDDLRYDANSIEALEQFINMELVVLGRDNDTREVVGLLYDHPFTPLCDEDRNLWTRLMDHRIKFFGEDSKWINQVTFGDVIMYYGKAAEFNLGEDVRHWVDWFLTCADINNVTLTSEEFAYVIEQLSKHTFYNNDMESHGLFGLSSFQMTESIRIAHDRVDKQITFDIEFNNFMTAILERSAQ